MLELDTPLAKAFALSTSKPLADKPLLLETVGDLLRHYPRKWPHRGELTDLRELRADEYVTIFARVDGVSTVPLRNNSRMSKTDVRVTDGRAQLTLTFFSKGGWRGRQFTIGQTGYFAGKVDVFNRKLQMVNPEFEEAEQADESDAGFAGAIVPIYPASAKIGSMKIRQAVQVVLDGLGALEDPVPAAIRQALQLGDLRSAFDGIHRPKSDADVAAAIERLKFDEAFVMQTLMAQRRSATAGLPAASRIPRAGGLLDEFVQRLPFQLTAGQLQVGATIAAEIARDHPMHRLLQGEVGSGKTVVALLAMLAVVDAGGQAALLAPTEVLAQQHFRSISDMLGPFALFGQLGAAEHATAVTLLTGSMNQPSRRRALLDAASGAAGIVIGTHALLEEKVQFADLGLVVIDEQHRFGVEQRDALRAKAAADRRPHVLVMTATPIPRTVAMTVYGDLEISSLDELPKGRAPIVTHVAPVAEKPAWTDRIWQRVTEEVAAGHQVFVVCPRIGDEESSAKAVDDSEFFDESDGSDGSDGAEGGDSAPGTGTARRPPLAVLDIAPMLADGPLKGLRLEMLHGRMPPDDKDRVMRAFSDGAIDVLVSTTVIEVGVDVPNATAMVVLDADRFGISQLHQLRGRVGRGGSASICLLVTELPPAAPARDRLDAVAATSDGFRLAELDLEQRREGTILGEQQHGRSDLKLLSLARDRAVVEQARSVATDVIADDPTLEAHPGLRTAVARLLASEGAQYLEKA
jgi:ATP-dependent DNA helicase RecG